MIRLFKRAVSYGFKIDYVLVDSWFTCEAIIDAIARVKNQTIHFIGMYKIAKTLFEYNGDKLTYSQIRNRLGRPKRCRKLKLYYLQAFVEFKGHKLQLFFTRQGKNGTWKVLLTTDCSLSFIRTADLAPTLTWAELPATATWDSFDGVAEALVANLVTDIDQPGQFELELYNDGEANALSLVQIAAQSGRGVLYEGPSGELFYDDFISRSLETALSLTAG